MSSGGYKPLAEEDIELPSLSRRQSYEDDDSDELVLNQAREQLLRGPPDGRIKDDDGEDDEDSMLEDELREKSDDPLDDSPEALIRKCVPETDNPTLTTITFRVILLGSVFCILGASTSQLFYFKSNTPRFSGYFVTLASYPIGKWLASILPDTQVGYGKWSFSLNPGPFSIKEHMLIGIFATSGGTSAYATDIIAIQRLYYKQDIGAVAGILLLLTTQLVGFGLCGILQPILVRPPAMYFPSTLPFVTLYNTLHTKGQVTRDRLRYFIFAFIAVFIYQTVPTLLFPTLNTIALLCFLDNRSFVLRTLGSGFEGFGLLNFSFDWSSVGQMGPLYTPFWAQMNFIGGLGGMMYLVMPILFFSNWWDAMKFSNPITSALYNTSFGRFDMNAVINPDFTLNEEAWERQGPLLLTPYFALSYGIGFMALTSVVMHVILWHHSDITNAISRSRSQKVYSDVHNRLMSVYPEVPIRWYMITLLVTIGTAMILMYTTPLQLPVWGLCLAIFIALVFLVPIGIVAAVSQTTIGLNIITEFVAGFLLPGKPIANVTFKCYGLIGVPDMAMVQALDLTTDLKLSVYMKIPPKHMFITQTLGTALGCFVNYYTLNSVIDSKQQYIDGTTVDPTGQWTGRKPAIFYSASVIWGLVGPSRFFAGKYHVLYYGFLAGAVLPLIPWFLHRRYPKLLLHRIAIPIICHGAGIVPELPTNTIMLGFAASFASQVWARRYRPKWFDKYNYVLSAALDAGTSMNALIVYFLFTIVLGGWNAPTWWGNPLVDAEHCKAGS